METGPLKFSAMYSLQVARDSVLPVSIELAGLKNRAAVQCSCTIVLKDRKESKNLLIKLE